MTTLREFTENKKSSPEVVTSKVLMSLKGGDITAYLYKGYKYPNYILFIIRKKEIIGTIYTPRKKKNSFENLQDYVNKKISKSVDVSNVIGGLTISENSSVGKNTILGTDNMIYSNSKIGNNCHIKQKVFIEAGVIIGDNVVINERCHIEPKVKIPSNIIIPKGIKITKKTDFNNF